MTPPGRRRFPSSRVILSLLTLSLFSSAASAASAVLGIDLGTEYIKAALVKPGIPLEIVLTKDSKRKEAATLAFKPSRVQTTDAEALPERLYGGDAVALGARFPGDVYPNLKTLLGIPVDSVATEEYRRRYPGLDVEPVVRNESSKESTVGFKSQTFGTNEPAFMVEELLAMEFKNIKANAEAAAGKGSEITDVVLNTPAFYTAEEKRALKLSADLAGLRVLGLITDGLAVGLNYATSRTFASISEGAKPEYHLVYDMGAGSTTATVLKFQGRTVKGVGKRNKTIQEVQVMSTNWEKDLGGDLWNQLIVEDMIAKLVEVPKMKTSDVMPIHVKKSGKTIARLWKEAERMRQVLSANSQTSATFEGLFSEDVTFKYKLSRAEFEELAVPAASQVSAPLVKALDAAGITVQTLDSVILHGGAVRTPFVQKRLEAVAGGSIKIRTNVNADEAAVLGAAFKAAGLSPSFRVKDIRAEEVSGFDLRLRWVADGKERTQKLFTTHSLIGTEKQVPLKVQEDFTFEISQRVDEKDAPVSAVTATNLTASVAQLRDKYACIAANISTKFAIRLNPVDGLPEVMSGSVSCDTAEVFAKDGGVMDNVKGLFGFGGKKTDQQPLTQDGSSLEETASSPASSSETASVSSPASTSTTSTLEKPAKPTSTTFTIPLLLESRPLGLNLPLPADLSKRIRDRLAELDRSDHLRMLRAEALNTLESFTYRARDYLADPSFVAYSPQIVRDTLDQKLGVASEWLYGDGVEAKLSDFQERLKGLKDLVEPVLNRQEEASKRDDAVKGLEDGLDQLKGMIEMVSKSVQRAEDDKKAAESALEAASSTAKAESSTTAAVSDKAASADPSDDLDDDPYSSSSTSSSTTEAEAPAESNESVISPYSAADLQTLQSSYDAATEWLKQKTVEQARLSQYDDPVITVRELDAKARDVQLVVREVVMKNIKLPGMGGAKKGRASGGGGGAKSKKAKLKGKGKKGDSASTATSAGAADGADTERASSSSSPLSSSSSSSSASASASASASTSSASASASSSSSSSSRKDEL